MATENLPSSFSSSSVSSACRRPKVPAIFPCADPRTRAPISKQITVHSNKKHELYSQACCHSVLGSVPCGIAGNEAADQRAAAAALRDSIDIKLAPYQDLTPFVRRKLRDHWQQRWDEAISNELRAIEPRIKEAPAEKHAGSIEVALCRFRIGCTHTSHIRTC